MRSLAVLIALGLSRFGADDPPRSVPPSPFDGVAALLSADPSLTLSHQGADTNVGLTLLTTGGTTTLCASGGSTWTRCFAGDWPADGLYDAMLADGRVCVSVRHRGIDTDRSFAPEGGPLRAGCGDETRPNDLKTPQATALVEGVAALGTATVVSLGPGSAVIHDDALDADTARRRTCVRLSDRLACERPRQVATAGLITLNYASLQVSTDGAWVAILRSRVADAGIDARLGDDAVLLYRATDEGLRLHGVLPIGGHEGERLGEGHPDFVWVTRSVSASFVLGKGGCIQVRSKGRVAVRPTDERPTMKRLRASKAASSVSGDDVEIWEAEPVMDASGAWMPRNDGTFERTRQCGG